MKVLHVIDKLNIGGAERVFIDITHLLVEDGVNVGVMLFNEGGALDKQLDDRLNVHVLNRVNKYAINKMYEANKICTEYNIVHVHMRHVYAYMKVAQKLFRGKYTIVFHDHFGDIDINSAVPKSMKGMLRPDYYIGVSRSLVDWAVSTLGVSKDNAFLLSNTVIPNKDTKFTAKQQWQKGMMVANIRPTKNLEFAVELAKKAGFALDIYGNRSDEEYYSKIVALIGDNKNIKLIEGVTNFKDIYDQYDFAIHTAKSETGPLVLMEYMAYGIPFIAYRTGEVAEQVNDVIPQHLMESFEQEEWIKRMKGLSIAKDTSKKLKEVFNKYFSPEQYIATCRRIYESVDY